METTTQHSKIIKVLKANPVRGVPNHRFTDMHILDYTARISELRKEGYNIYCERVKRDGRATYTFLYYLNDDAVVMIPEQPKTHWWSRKSNAKQ